VIIGLTGGIGSGKSLALSYFQKLKIDSIGADSTVKKVIDEDECAKNELIKLLGKEIIDSNEAVDRKILREKIFNDDILKAKVESIIHPIVQNKIMSFVGSSSSAYVVVEVPLIYETNSTKNYDRILVIDCSEHLQFERAMARDKSSRVQISNIIKSQCTRSERLSIASDVIRNTGTGDELKKKIYELHNFYISIVNGR
tara:strand:+ start:468 stop:1064 length:597 start_codon:yes stop_codon:yes gene_type:complete